MSDLHEAAGSYALNALDPAELDEFEAHLATCEICRDDVAELCEVAAELSLLALAAPPPSLRDNILATIQDTPQLPPEESDEPADDTVLNNGSRSAVESRRAVPTSQPRRALPATAVPDEPESPVPAVDEVAQRRQRRRSRFLTGLVAALLALAVGLGGVVYSLVQDRQAQVAQISLEQQLYAAPDVEFRPTDLKGGGKATFVFSQQLNRALFIGSDLPDPGSDKRYQLWTMNGPEPKWVVATSITRDTQITDRDAAVRVFFSGDIAGADWLCVSLEPKDNLSNRPTVPPAGAAEVP
jgi:anti-sigma-K factor RskA/putative zinc finger protein